MQHVSNPINNNNKFFLFSFFFPFPSSFLFICLFVSCFFFFTRCAIVQRFKKDIVLVAKEKERPPKAFKKHVLCLCCVLCVYVYIIENKPQGGSNRKYSLEDMVPRPVSTTSLCVCLCVCNLWTSIGAQQAKRGQLWVFLFFFFSKEIERKRHTRGLWWQSVRTL